MIEFTRPSPTDRRRRKKKKLLGQVSIFIGAIVIANNVNI